MFCDGREKYLHKCDLLHRGSGLVFLNFGNDQELTKAIPETSASDNIDYVLIAVSVAAGLIAFIYLLLV